MNDDNALLSDVEVSLTHNVLAFFYEAVTPTLTINGIPERRPWGTYLFRLPPGEYEVAASYPWVIPECGKNTVRFWLAPGETKRVTYHAHFIRFVPGAMTVESLFNPPPP